MKKVGAGSNRFTDLTRTLYDTETMLDKLLDHLFLKWPHLEKDFSFIYVDDLDVVADEVNGVIGTLLPFLEFF